MTRNELRAALIEALKYPEFTLPSYWLAIAKAALAHLSDADEQPSDGPDLLPVGTRIRYRRCIGRIAIADPDCPASLVYRVDFGTHGRWMYAHEIEEVA